MKTGPTAIVLAALTAVAGAQELTPKTYRKWRQQILPRKSELAWRRVGWHHQLRDALVAAKQKDRPVLLWAMNGHPLGCT